MEALSESAILSILKTRFIGRHVIYFPQLGSTMDAARQATREGAPEGTLVITEEQTTGRGRRGRTWFSLQGGLAFSVVLYPPLSQLPYLVMIASLAVVRSIEALTSLHAGIKWPNDILINGKKVCGILIESALKGNGVEFSIIGIGLNVNGAPPVLQPPAIPATTLATETGKDVSRLKLLSSVLGEIEQLYLAARAGRSPFHEWRARLETLGGNVMVFLNGETVLGIAEDVEESGNLRVRSADGKFIKVVAGDVSLRM